jgi:hypothetical protein
MAELTLDHDDLRDEGLTSSWTQTNRLIDEHGFPPGRIHGKRRIWLRQEVADWLLARPADRLPPRGRAKQLAIGKAAKPGKAVR